MICSTRGIPVLLVVLLAAAIGFGFFGCRQAMPGPNVSTSASGTINVSTSAGVANAIAPGAVTAGSTVILAGGTYQAPADGFNSYLTGSTLRCAPGERCTILLSGSATYAALVLWGDNSTYWDLEIKGTTTDRIGDFGPDGVEGNADDDKVGPTSKAVQNFGNGNKVIGFHMYDASGGIGPTSRGGSFELYWSNIRHNGVDLTDRGHGHGVYAQNAAPYIAIFEHNVFWPGFGGGAHLYGSANASLDNFQFRNNVMFGNAPRGSGTDNAVGFVDFVIGGTTGATLRDSVVDGNLTYEVSSKFGYYTGGSLQNAAWGCWRVTVKDNYIVRTGRWHQTTGAGLSTVDVCAAGFLGVGPMAHTFTGPDKVIGTGDDVTATQNRGGSMTGNTFIGPIEDFGPDESVSWRKAPGNTFQKTFPTTDRVFVQHHKYDPSKHRLIVFNWDKSPTQAFDLAALAIAVPGQMYQLRSAQNPFGPAILAGTYAGGNVSVAMVGHPIEPALGAVEVQKDTGPDFQVFEVQLAAGVPTPTATPAPTLTPVPPTPAVTSSRTRTPPKTFTPSKTRTITKRPAATKTPKSSRHNPPSPTP